MLDSGGFSLTKEEGNFTFKPEFTPRRTSRKASGGVLFL